MHETECDTKVAVITGAASGIGLALARCCLQQHMHVVIADISNKHLQSIVGELNQQYSTQIVGILCDVRKSHDVKQLARKVYKQFNHVDLLINNAGISGPISPLWDLSLTQINNVLKTNVLGIIHGIQSFFPFALQKQPRFHVVNMASVYGLCSGSGVSAYAMSKHAVVALSESLYFDIKRLDYPIDVSVVCPSLVNTNLLASSSVNDNFLHEQVAELMRHCRPAEDVAEYIMKEVHKKVFYILPDKEIKDYCEHRMEAIIQQSVPHEHSLEQIMQALGRKEKRHHRSCKNA